ncbi:hypothetical protein HJC23_005986 [Cyclotella cryptica]|uniref:Uncharacterized protein n=1 Tax=Cyclotella cryptica TaxID=29204 RepID=A0ABD3NVR1_9STRA
MKTAARKFLATAAIVAISKSDASTSSVRGGGKSNRNSRIDSAGSKHDGGDAFNGLLSRRSLNHVSIRRNDETSQANQRQIQEEPSSYWWLNKKSNEKDIAYKPNEDEAISTYSNSLFKTHYEKEKEDGLNSFSVYTIAVDKNPDTSGLPYRSPSKKPTERPTSLPTEDITTDAPTPHQKVEQYTKKVVDAEKMYFYPIWADTFKGCASSAVPPDAYLASPSEYIFTALSECCQFWFDSAAECLSSRDRSKEDYSVNMDEYMFQMNGAEAYSDGDATSEDVNASLDVPTPPPLPVVNTMPPAMASLFPTPAGDVTFPPVGVTSPTPTYMPTLGDGVEVPGGGVSPP